MKCPHCGRQVYSRLRRACDFCGNDYPEGIRLPDEEIQAIKEGFAREEESRIRSHAEAEEQSVQDGFSVFSMLPSAGFICPPSGDA